MGVVVVPVGDVHEAVVETVRDVVRSRFDSSTQIATPVPLPQEALDAERNQYQGERLLAALGPAADGTHRLGVSVADIYYGDRDYVFGLAEPGGNALIGCDRLTRTRDGADRASPRTVTARIRKEAVHELGHVYGLAHCTDKQCVMSFSGDVAGIDRKSPSFCADCDEQRREMERTGLGGESGPQV